MNSEDLNVDNFILSIKKMNKADRKKIRADKLIDLILLLGDKQENEPQQYEIFEKKLAELETKYDFVRTEMLTNKLERHS